jgi:hypothetical protein
VPVNLAHRTSRWPGLLRTHHRCGCRAASSSVDDDRHPSRVRFDVESLLVPDRDGSLLSLQVDIRWPRGLRLVGRIIEFAILSSKEARQELRNLKMLLEQEVGPT